MDDPGTDQPSAPPVAVGRGPAGGMPDGAAAGRRRRSAGRRRHGRPRARALVRRGARLPGRARTTRTCVCSSWSRARSPAVMAQIGQRLPDALMRALGDNPGFGPAANQALRLVEGAGFFCFLHDDVALDPSTISELVEETYRSNAGIVGPKLVDWDRPGACSSTSGSSADRVGVTARDGRGRASSTRSSTTPSATSSACPTACLLVRTDLFRALGGFDPGHRLLRRRPRPVLAGPPRRAPGCSSSPTPAPATASACRSGARTSTCSRCPSATACAPRCRRPTGFHLVGLSVFHVLYTICGHGGRAPQRPGPARCGPCSAPGCGSSSGCRLCSPAAAGSRPRARSPTPRWRASRVCGARPGCATSVASGRPSGRVVATGCRSSGGDLRQQLGGEDARANVVVWRSPSSCCWSAAGS